MSVEEIIARAFQVLVAMTGAYLVALWFALVVWTFRDIESRSPTELAPPALEEGEEAQLEERRPSFLPRPLRLLHERTEVRVEHSMGLVSPDEAPQLPDGEPGSLVARETQQAGAWADDSGKRAWI